MPLIFFSALLTLMGCVSSGEMEQSGNGAADDFTSPEVDDAIDNGLVVDVPARAQAGVGRGPSSDEAIVKIDMGDATCTGTAVGRYLVLTARHCVQGYALRAIHILVGEDVVTSVAIVDRYIPNARGSSNDIALLQTASVMPATSGVDFNTYTLPVGTSVTATHFAFITGREIVPLTVRHTTSVWYRVDLLPEGASGCGLVYNGNVVATLRGFDDSNGWDRYVRVSNFHDRLCNFATSKGLTLNGC